MREESLETFKAETFRNAIRLFRDACILYVNGSYPSAFALGVLSYEEIGKLQRIDRVCDAMCLNPESRADWYNFMTSGDLLTDHRQKQISALLETDAVPLHEPRTRFVVGGGLDQGKQQALYVDLQNDKVVTPSQITREKAYGHLKECLRALESCGDVGFNGFHCISTPKSEWLAREEMTLAQASFTRCEPPR